MLVYGDPKRELDVSETLDALEHSVAQASSDTGLARHERLVGALIEAGMLAQGLLDDELERNGCDDVSLLGDAAMALVLEFARAVDASDRSAYRISPQLDRAVFSHVRALGAPSRVTAKLPEGFVFYAIYPELYLEAARRVRGHPLQVIGLRSIGTTLGALVTAGAKSSRPVITVRPTGHPFSRELRLSAALEDRIEPKDTFAIVDEGPGLSGSSIFSALEYLDRRGVEADRAVVFPSHSNGPGAMGSDERRARWRRAPSAYVSFEELLLHGTGRRSLVAWVEDLVGPLIAPLQDLGGGLWRTKRFGSEDQWPGVDVFRERRKFLVRTAKGEFLLKFVGLGELGERVRRRTQAFADAGLTPAPMGLRYGFLVSRWLGEARSVSGSSPGELLSAVRRHLAVVSRFPSSFSAGASPESLLEMAAFNLAASLGSDAGERIRQMFPDLPELARERQPVESDNRMHSWEWLVDGAGRILKTDLDHHCAHDLVGCQDLAWDLAGARFELGLDSPGFDELLRTVRGELGYQRSSRFHELHAVCYLGFEIGRAELGARGLEAGGLPDEARRLRVRARALVDRARQWLRA